MTHKVHPKVFRIRDISHWLSRGFYRTPAGLKEDFEIRKFIDQKIGKTGIEKVEIERSQSKVSIIIFSARPGLIIKRGGEGVEQLRADLLKVLHKIQAETKEKTEPEEKKNKSAVASKPIAGRGKASGDRREIKIEIREVKNPWTSASLSAQWVAQQIEKRVPFRIVLKQSIGKIIANKEAQGAKVEVSGRLNGVEIARREWLKEGRLPLQTIRADIDFSRTNAHCTYGVIGVKVWIFKGEKFD